MRKRILILTLAVSAALTGPVGAERDGHHPHRDQGRSDSIVLDPVVIPVGKWAEGIAYDGQWLWAAESGQRTLAKIDLKQGRVVSHLKAGRLPVALAATSNGMLFAMINTDKLIYSASGPRPVLTRLGECPSAMIADGMTLWALTEPQCSSVSSRVIKVDSRTGAQTPSAVLGEWATALTVNSGKIWVTHARGAALTIINPDSLRTRRMDVNGASLWAVTGNDDAIFAGGRVNEDNGAGLVVMIDPARSREIRRAETGERIAAMTCDADMLVAVGEKGTIWIYAADNLKLLRTINLSSGAFQPRGVLIHKDKLLLSSQMQRGENGAVLSLSNWRPE